MLRLVFELENCCPHIDTRAMDPVVSCDIFRFGQTTLLLKNNPTHLQYLKKTDSDFNMGGKHFYGRGRCS